jgi:hypothetical protein
MGYIVIKTTDNAKVSITTDFKNLFLIKYGKDGPKAFKMDTELLQKAIQQFGEPVDVSTIKEISISSQKRKNNSHRSS